eukprot:TRINITY_DN607_c0_g1_i1.p1 TRINITY_DN607_c0_g1~~TRINITY_DN607_c0_g1_i1.p1  ORF type:complete len:219 (-),score=25.13 TRINITY_DN607_c0_g1_i1:64-720(-)
MTIDTFDAEKTTTTAPVVYSNDKNWQFNTRWNLLIWIEIFLKIAAQIIACVTLTTITHKIQVSLLNVFECIILGALILLYLPSLVASFGQKESMGFSIGLLNLGTHAGMMIAILYGKTGLNLVLYAGVIVVADIYRLVYMDTLSVYSQPDTIPVFPKREILPKIPISKVLTFIDFDDTKYSSVPPSGKRFLFVYVITLITLYVILMVSESIRLVDINS